MTRYQTRILFFAVIRGLLPKRPMLNAGIAARCRVWTAAAETMLCLEALQAKSSELLVDPIDAELDATGQSLKPQAV